MIYNIGNGILKTRDIFHIQNGTFPHFGKPNAKSKGIEYVIVNGELVAEKEKFSKIRAGRTIRL